MKNHPCHRRRRLHRFGVDSQLIAESGWRIRQYDKLTYAGNLESLAELADHPRHVFSRSDICDRGALDYLFGEHQPAGVIHLAAERMSTARSTAPATSSKPTSTHLHAARSSPRLLVRARTRSQGRIPLPSMCRPTSLRLAGRHGPVRRDQPLPAKLALLRLQGRLRPHGGAPGITYGLPTVITNCSNNYGPCQFRRS